MSSREHVHRRKSSVAPSPGPPAQSKNRVPGSEQTSEWRSEAAESTSRQINFLQLKGATVTRWSSLVFPCSPLRGQSWQTGTRCPCGLVPELLEAHNSAERSKLQELKLGLQSFRGGSYCGVRPPAGAWVPPGLESPYSGLTVGGTSCHLPPR